MSYLRNGTLACEHNPQMLMQMYNTSSLEEVIYITCNTLNEKEKCPIKSNDHDKQLVRSMPDMEVLDRSITQDDNSLKSKIKTNINKQYIVLRRTFKIYLKEQYKLFALVIFPFAMICYYNLVYWKLPDRLPIGVINNDTMFKNISLANEILHLISDKEQTVLVSNFNNFMNLT